MRHRNGRFTLAIVVLLAVAFVFVSPAEAFASVETQKSLRKISAACKDF